MVRIYLFIALLISAPPLYALESYINMEGFVYTGPVPYNEFINDWSTGFQENSDSIGYTWLEAGVHNDHWGLAIVQHQYAQMLLSDDTAELFYLTQNKLPIETGRRYQIDYQVNAFTTEGVRLFHRARPFQSLFVQVGAHIMKGSELQHGRINGDITSNGDRDYNFNNLELEYHYSEDKIFDKVADATTGEGFAFDLAAHWQLNRNDKISLDIRNIGGQIRWKDNPYMTGTIESDNKSYDENGYVTVDPLLNGNILTDTYRQTLPMLWQGEIEHQYSKRSKLLAQATGTEIQNFYRLGIDHRVFGNQHLRLLYTINTQSYGFAYENSWLNIQMQFDSSKLSESHTIGLIVQADYGF